MAEVAPLVRDLLISFGNEDPGLLQSLGSFLLSGKGPLASGQVFLDPPEVFRVLDNIPVGVGEKGCCSYVDAPGFVNRPGEFPGGDIITGKDNEPLAGGSSPDSDRFDLSFDRSGEEERQPADVADMEIPTIEFPASLLQRERIVSVPGFDPGEVRLPVLLTDLPEEIGEGPVQALDDILENLGSHCLEFREFLLEGWKFHRLVIA